MTDTNEWIDRVGHAWAEEWRRTDRSFGALTERLLDPAALGPFRAALDIGCGAGELVERLAAHHPAAHVRGVDISHELLEVAGRRCASFPNARFELADAARWTPTEPFAPDLLISRHGVMFFAEPAAAFAHLRGLAAPNARLRFSCFRAREDNGWAAELASVLPAPPVAPDPAAPGPFAFGDPARVESILGAAGWNDLAFEPVDYAMIAGEGEDAVEEALAYFQRIGPAARAIAELPETDRPPVREHLRALLASHERDGQVAMPASCWLVTARAP
jgi:SAM-dependent methyltransferase